MSRDSSRDRSHNRSRNQSLNDSVEERRKRVLGGVVTRTDKNPRIGNILPDLALEKSGQKLFGGGRNFVEENKQKMLEAKVKKGGLLVKPNSTAGGNAFGRGGKKEPPRENPQNTSSSSKSSRS